MALKLKVPFCRQRVSMECWYASACMVAWYFEAGPRLGIPKTWVNNKGLSPQEFVRLAKNEHLIPVRGANSRWTAASLEHLLLTKGPIWCAGFWYGLPHVVVPTGVDDSTVFLNDPDGAQGTIDWFNYKLAKNIPECMMRHER